MLMMPVLRCGKHFPVIETRILILTQLAPQRTSIAEHLAVQDARDMLLQLLEVLIVTIKTQTPALREPPIIAKPEALRGRVTMMQEILGIRMIITAMPRKPKSIQGPPI